MTSLPPLSVTVCTRRRACVLDTDLALSRHGLLLALRICEEFDLWLVRELWEILDNTTFFLEHPESLAPIQVSEFSQGPLPPPTTGRDWDGEGLRDVLSQWELARVETDLGGLGIFWVGDARSESYLPRDTDQNLLARFESLAAALDVRIPEKWDAHRPLNIRLDCFRDAAALAAALTAHRGFVLSRCLTGGNGGSSEAPAICSYLDRLGIGLCRPTAADDLIRREREHLWPILTRAGVTELLWDGLCLAVIHILAPRSILIPWSAKAREGYPDRLDFGETIHEPLDWWKDAKYFWYPL
jgi:hypothetical protein